MPGGDNTGSGPALPKSTSAQRMKKMRERLKLTNPNHQAEENKRIADLKKNKRRSMSDKEKEALKKYERDRKRLQRAKKNNAMLSGDQDEHVEQSPIAPYSCKATFSKAIWKTSRALPNSPRKQKAVIHGLAKRFGIQLQRKMDCNMSETCDNETIDLVREFFFRSDIVYTCPGIKDQITIWENGKKFKLPKYYLTVFLKEALSIFKEENPEFPIGYSKFCSLRPKNVLLMQDTPPHQCLCKIHQNFILKLRGLSPQYNYSNEFWQSMLCNTDLNSTCWRNECDECKNGKLMLRPANPEGKGILKEWKKDDNGRLKLMTKETTQQEIYDLVIADFPQMMSHVNTKRIQQQEFEFDKAQSNTRILQIDFAMSYNCEYQNEVQSALWSRSTVTLFTAAFFYGGTTKTTLICSNVQDKGKDTVFTFLDVLYDNIFRESTSRPKFEIIWSDGPSSEFKNKFMVKALQILSDKYKTNFSWKYFATSHGKGVIDGVGGNVKRLVRIKSMSQGKECTIQSARDFAELATTVVDKTDIFYVEEDHIRETIEVYQPWAEVLPVVGIQKMHVILLQADKSVVCKPSAKCADSEILVINKQCDVSATPECSRNVATPDHILEVQDWVLVNYEGVSYPGTITKVLENEVEVSVMVPCDLVNSLFKWPARPDVLLYPIESVVKKLSNPELVNSRGVFKFTEIA